MKVLVHLTSLFLAAGALAQEAPGKIDLLSAIDFSRDVISGKFERNDSGLKLAGDNALARVPIQVHGSYKISARVRRTSGEQQIGLILPAGEKFFTVVLDWNTHDYHGLETVDGRNVGQAQLYKELPFESGKWYEWKIDVVRESETNVRITSHLDGDQLFDWRGNKSSLTLWERWAIPDKHTIGLVVHGPSMAAEFSKLDLELSARDAKSAKLAVDRKAAAPVVASSPGPATPDPSAPQPNVVERPARPVPVVRLPSTGGEWPCFRGPGRLGISRDLGLPESWADGENILWKAEMPGPGTSSPVVWGDRVYLTCFSGYGESEEAPGDQGNLKRHLVCVDRTSGRILWQADMENRAAVFPFQEFRLLHGYASSTPVVDATGVYVFYGSSGAAAYSHDGRRRWWRSLGTRIDGWGTASSPLLFEDLMIVHADIEGQSLVALNKEDGEEAWRVESGAGDSWSTPCLARVGDRNELVFHHSRAEPGGSVARIAAVDPRDGRRLWECRALKNYLAPSPIVVGDMCYTIAYGQAAAIRLGGEGDVTDTHLEWTTNRGTEVCTPIYHDGHLYWAHQESGLAYCLDAATGREVYRERLTPKPGKIYASGVLADGRIYYVSRENGTYIVAATPEFRQLGHNTIESDTSVFNASPAISKSQLLLRSRKFLYCIGKPE